jgi:hypothetical protein
VPDEERATATSFLSFLPHLLSSPASQGLFPFSSVLEQAPNPQEPKVDESYPKQWPSFPRSCVTVAPLRKVQGSNVSAHGMMRCQKGAHVLRIVLVVSTDLCAAPVNPPSTKAANERGVSSVSLQLSELSENGTAGFQSTNSVPLGQSRIERQQKQVKYKESRQGDLCAGVDDTVSAIVPGST